MGTMRAALLPRIGFAALVVAMAALSGRAAMVASTRAGSPRAALRIDVSDPVALATENDRRLLQVGGRGLPAGMAKRAQLALRSDPLNAPALRQLGLVRDAAGDHLGARRLLGLANRVSRRDLGTHIWMIEDRVAAGDVRGAMAAYDLALSVSDDARKLLFPVLTTAIAEPQIRAAFLPYMARQRRWVPGFLNYAIATSTDPQGLAAMILARGGMPTNAGYRPLETQLVGKLVETGHYDMARAYAASLRAGAGGVLENAGIDDRTANPALAPLTWQFPRDGDVLTDRDGDTMTVQIEPNIRGIAASRIFVLPPGAYRFAYAVSPLAQSDSAPVAWELRCLPQRTPDVPPLWQQRAPVTPAAVRYSATITIPVGCVAQQLAMIVTGGDLQSQSGVRVGPIVMGRVPVRDPVARQGPRSRPR